MDDKTRLIAATWEIPFRLAVMFTLWLEPNEPAVAVKLAEVEPAATVIAAGTLKDALLLTRLIEEPLVGAA